MKEEGKTRVTLPYMDILFEIVANGNIVKMILYR